MMTEDEREQLYLMILKQPLDDFLKDLKNHNSKIGCKQKKVLRIILEEFHTEALNTLKEE